MVGQLPLIEFLIGTVSAPRNILAGNGSELKLAYLQLATLYSCWPEQENAWVPSPRSVAKRSRCQRSLQTRLLGKMTKL